ncbi:MAG TPA: serine/threonine-protein kinase [Allosphingosinicella sp.]|jgi:serine/threonine-protein kinase|uniref:serine/threonine-protein kinase n=1 Tax=Allosphingosinicella sp. TaxID=2823234 RepID=UPI002F29F8F1
MSQAEIELRALAIFERLAERPGDRHLRERLLRREAAEVADRVSALERASQSARRWMPTDFDGVSGEAPPPPERIGPFRLTAQIGEGGMGQVWRGERDDGLYDQAVAIKLIHAHLTPIAATRFADERRILARLEHPGIARLIDGGIAEGGQPYLVMELVEGRPIDEACDGQPLRERVATFIKAADAVQFAHSRLVVHADLKPSNILVAGSGWVKLLDFGIARLLDGDERAEAPQHPMTRAYASPARVAGAGPTIADDVYALGMILRELIGAAGDRDLDAIAVKAAADDEAERYGSVTALIGDLERWQERLPVTARPATLGYRSARFVARHRLGVSATAAALVLLLATSVVATLSYFRAERARAEASARFEDARGTSRYLLYRLSDRLERQPGSLPLRAEVARVSQHYLTRLAASENAPAEVRLEAAEGLIRLAERLGAPGRPSFGQGEAARANLERAIQAIGEDASPQAAQVRARALIARARLEMHTFNNLPAASQALHAAATIARSSPRHELGADFLVALASLRMAQGRYADTIRHTRAVLDVRVPPNDYKGLVTQAYATELLGDATYYSDPTIGVANSIAVYRRLIRQWEAIGIRWPGDPLASRRVPMARYSLATTLLGHDPATGAREAEALLAKASREMRAVSEAEPSDRETARQYMVVRGGHGQALAALRRFDEAIAIARELIAFRLEEWRSAPTEPRRLREYAVSIAILADMEADAGREASACWRYGKVMQLFEQLRRIDRQVRLDEDYGVRLVRQRQARHCRS